MDPNTDPLGLVGTTIAEKYAIESVVGQGGFAIVYRAMHTLWKRPVAVKVFKALGDVRAEDRQKLLDDFIQEGALLADLSERSSAICQARDVGMLTGAPGREGDAIPYMVLEWLEGAALETVIADERQRGLPLRSLEETVHLLDAVAEALALAHRKGIAHRDVKPANVFVLGDPRGEYSVKLLDFGIAKVVQDAQKMGFGKTSGNITSFTPSYGAPEQFNRSYGSTGPWTDVFALALVAVEVLTGRDPLDGETLVQLAYAASDPAKRPTPRARGALIPVDAEVVFAKALAVKPDDRYPTAGEFWNALRTIAVGHGMPLRASVADFPVAAPAGAAAPAGTAAGTADSAAGTGDAMKSGARDAFAATAVAPPSGSGSGPGSASGAVSASGAGSGAYPPSSHSVPDGGQKTLPEPAEKKKSLPWTAVAVAAVVVLGGVGAAIGLKGKAPPAAPPPRPAAVVVASAPLGAKCPPEMKLIAGGEYYMGSEEKDALPNEKPAHQVKIGPYCLDELEVTVAEFKECSDHGGCLRAGKDNWWQDITDAEGKIYDPLCNINDYENKQKHPVNCVTWAQAKQYCEYRNERLPTEAEWEFAARGSDGRVYPWGDAPPSAQLLNACGAECVAWMKEHPDPGQPIASMFPDSDGYPNTAPVGSFPKGASQWGIQDLVGNVWEWTADWYAEYDPASAATLETNPRGPETGTEKIARGGAWNGSVASWVRPSFRFKYDPKNRSYGIGFRCAKTL